VPAPNPRRGAAPKKSTCPWGTEANDLDSARLADAARRRQRDSPKNFGAAGSGAPKLPPSMGEAGIPANLSKCFPGQPLMGEPEAGFPAQNAQLAEEAADMTQRPGPQPTSDTLASNAGGAEFAPVGDDEDEEQREQRELIQHCLAEGLEEDQILEILDEWQNQKLIQRTQERMHPEQPQEVAEPKGSDQASSLAASGTSLAASRQAKAKKNLSFGPTDEEIVGVLQDFAKENQTPPEAPPNSLGLEIAGNSLRANCGGPNSLGLEIGGQSVSLAAKRKKDREASEASVGSFSETKSRAAYLQSKQQLDAVKRKNALSSGIF